MGFVANSRRSDSSAVKKKTKKPAAKPRHTIEPYDGEVEKLWNITFVGDYAVITTTVEALNEDDAIVLAENLLTDYYDWDLSKWGAEAEEAL